MAGENLSKHEASTAAFSLAVVAGRLHRPGRKNEDAAAKWAVLRYLAGTSGPSVSANMFAAEHGVTARSARRAMALLSDEGYLMRQQDPRNLRGVTYSLSPKGEQALQEDPLLRLAARLSSQFAEDELDDIAAVLWSLSLNAREWAGPHADGFGSLGRFAFDGAARGDDVDGQAGDVSYPVMQPAAASPQAFAIVRVLSFAARTIDKAGSTPAMTRREWNALRYFAAVKPEGATLSDCATCFRYSLATASKVVSDAQAKGFLTSASDPADKRLKYISATPDGQRMLRRDPNRRIALVLEKQFSANELNIFTRAMASIFLEEGLDDACGVIPSLFALPPALSPVSDHRR